MKNGAFVYKSCNTGKSASNALVSTKGFVNSERYVSLLTAMGLSDLNTWSAPLNGPSKCPFRALHAKISSMHYMHLLTCTTCKFQQVVHAFSNMLSCIASNL